MPGATAYPIVGHPGSRAELRHKKGLGDAIYEFLDRHAEKDTYRRLENFDLKTFNVTDFWTAAAGAGATTWAYNAQIGGALRGVTGATAATSGLQIYTPVIFGGDYNCEVIWKWKSDVITELRIECGFASTIPSVNTPFVNSLATPTFNTTANGAVWLYNHTGSTTTKGLYTIGTAIAAAKQANTNSLTTPTVATWQTVRIKVLTNRVLCWVDGILAGEATAGTTDYIEGGTAATVCFAALNNSTGSQNVDIYQCVMTQDQVA